jgi:hypothetical protein
MSDADVGLLILGYWFGMMGTALCLYWCMFMDEFQKKQANSPEDIFFSALLWPITLIFILPFTLIRTIQWLVGK